MLLHTRWYLESGTPLTPHTDRANFCALFHLFPPPFLLSLSFQALLYIYGIIFYLHAFAGKPKCYATMGAAKWTDVICNIVYR